MPSNPLTSSCSTRASPVACLGRHAEPLPALRRRPGDAAISAFHRTRACDHLPADRAPAHGEFREPLLERAIGIIYRHGTERWSHYFEAVPAERFDAWAWLEQTRAARPLAVSQPLD